MKCRALQAGISRANVGQYGQCGEDMRDVLRNIKYSKEKEIIKRVGGAKGGHWEVIIKK